MSQFNSSTTGSQQITAIPPSPLPVTMSSLEIAKLTGKRHDNVLHDIRRILNEAGLANRLLGCKETVHRPNPAGGKPIASTIYRLPRAECDLVVSGYSVKYRWAIIQRWHELEKQQDQERMTPAEFAEMLDRDGKVIVDEAALHHNDTPDLRDTRWMLTFDDAGKPVMRCLGDSDCVVNPTQDSSLHTLLYEALPRAKVATALGILSRRVGDIEGALQRHADAEKTRIQALCNVTYKQAADAITQVAKDHGRNAAIAILRQFGVDRLPSVKPEQWGEVLASCRALDTVPRALSAPQPAMPPAKTWDDPEKVETLLKSMRFRQDQMYQPILITPAQAAQMHRQGVVGPRQWAKIRSHIAQA